MNTAVSMDGDSIKVGDFVGWKSGIEQSGKVTAIKGATLEISVYDSNSGKHSITQQLARRCWLE